MTILITSDLTASLNEQGVRPLIFDTSIGR